MPASNTICPTADAASLVGVKTLSKAEQLVEASVFELADKLPSEMIGQLVTIAARIKEVALEIDQYVARAQ